MRKAVFLDRDGTINYDSGYTYKIEHLKFLPGVIEAIKLLNDHSWMTVVVSNQSGVARGYYSEKDVENFHIFMNNKLSEHGANIDAFYYCPHHPLYGVGEYKIDCQCRKPKPGLILKAAKDFNIDLLSSWIIGDSPSDVEAGHAAGCQGILLGKQGPLVEKDEHSIDNGKYTACNLLDAVKMIINHN